VEQGPRCPHTNAGSGFGGKGLSNANHHRMHSNVAKTTILYRLQVYTPPALSDPSDYPPDR
jgi:hypothetical protein